MLCLIVTGRNVCPCCWFTTLNEKEKSWIHCRPVISRSLMTSIVMVPVCEVQVPLKSCTGKVFESVKSSFRFPETGCMVPVRPEIVIDGAQVRKRGTLLIRVRLMVFSSHGYFVLCPICFTLNLDASTLMV